MSSKILLITILYQLVLSEQGVFEKIPLDSKQIGELQDLIKKLESQINTDENLHKPSDIPKNKGLTEGNDVINLFLQRADYNKDQSEGQLKGYDRYCKTGRCGCSGTKCGDTRAGSSSDEVTKLLDSLEKTIDKDMKHSHTRCGHGRCGKKRHGRSDNLRCKGEKCGRNKAGLDDGDDELNLRESSDIKQQLERYGKTYKINNQLDAVVLDAAKLKDAISELNRHCKYANCKIIDFASKSRTTAEISTEEDRIDGKDEESLDGVLLDLTDLSESNDLAKDLKGSVSYTIKSDDLKKQYLSPNELNEYFQEYKKTAINDIVGYIQNKNGRRESMKNLSGKQKQLVKNVKILFLKGGIGLNNKQIEKQVEEILFGKHSPTKIIAHGEQNRNIYVPKRLYNKIDEPKKKFNLRTHKRLLPLTSKQRNKLQMKPVHLWRRNTSSNYGLPFDLQVQGLGQVVP